MGVEFDLDAEVERADAEIRWDEVKNNIRNELKRLDTLAIDRLVELQQIMNEGDEELEKLMTDESNEDMESERTHAMEVYESFENKLQGLSRMGTLQVQEHIRAELEDSTLSISKFWQKWRVLLGMTMIQSTLTLMILILSLS